MPPQDLFVLADSEYEDGNVDVSFAPVGQVPDDLLEVGNAARHLVHEILDRNDLDARVDQALFTEDSHLSTNVVHHEGVLSKLDLQTELALYKVDLSKCSFVQGSWSVPGFVMLGRILAEEPTAGPSTLV